MTRWHADDLAGRLLAERAERWTVVRLPALAETQGERDANDAYLGLPTGQSDRIGRVPDEPLCPGRFSAEALAEIRRDVGSQVWAAEYQGVPRPAEGNRFKRTWFEIVEAVPAAFDALVRYWDKAATAGGGAHTAGVLMGTKGGVYYLLDVVRGQWSSLERELLMRQSAELDRQLFGDSVQIWVEQEPGSGGKESAEATVRNLAGFAVWAERVTGSKGVRAEPFAAQCEAGNVKLRRGAWNAAYLEEVCAFPNGAFKDQVDASSGAFGKVTMAGRGVSVLNLGEALQGAIQEAHREKRETARASHREANLQASGDQRSPGTLSRLVYVGSDEIMLRLEGAVYNVGSGWTREVEIGLAREVAKGLPELFRLEEV